MIALTLPDPEWTRAILVAMAVFVAAVWSLLKIARVL